MNQNLFTLLIFTFLNGLHASEWPVPYQRLDSRPKNPEFCQAGLVPFCPNGKALNQIPIMKNTDEIEVFALKKPVWSFKYGPLLGYFHVMHDGLGFKNKQTGLNYTMEWYELDQLFNCTFPHVLDNNEFIWCNQGALCVYDGINDTMWQEYGTLQKVSTISGLQFNRFANWSIYDNNTAVFYETWTVYNSDDFSNQNKSLIMYFDSFDCASWVLRALDELHALGARFNGSISLNYTRLNLISNEPQLLGNYSQIMNSSNQTLVNDFVEFYKIFQKRNDFQELLKQMLQAYVVITEKQRFFFYYNDLYWYLRLKPPYVKISYEKIPLPGTGKLNKKSKLTILT